MILYPSKYTIIFTPVVVFLYLIHTYHKEIKEYNAKELTSVDFWRDKVAIYSLFMLLTFNVTWIQILFFYLSGIDPPDLGFAYSLTAAPVVSVLFSSVIEEAVFRKMIFGYLDRKFNYYIGAVVSSLVFALGHMNYANWLGYFLLGLVWCHAYKKTGNIAVPIIIHIIWNLLSFIIYSMKFD